MFVVCNGKHAFTSSSLHTQQKVLCLEEEWDIQASEGLKGQSAQFLQGAGMTNACKNLCTTNYNSLSLLKALTLKSLGATLLSVPRVQLTDSKCYGLHSGCSLWTVLTCKSHKDLVICKVYEPLKHPNAELYNWETDHRGYSLVFGSRRAKWCCFLHLFIFTSQSRIQRHHDRGRQKYCWSYATQQLCENILVIDSVVYFSFLQRKQQQPNFISSCPIAASYSGSAAHVL